MATLATLCGQWACKALSGDRLGGLLGGLEVDEGRVALCLLDQRDALDRAEFAHHAAHCRLVGAGGEVCHKHRWRGRGLGLLLLASRGRRGQLHHHFLTVQLRAVQLERGGRGLGRLEGDEADALEPAVGPLHHLDVAIAAGLEELAHTVLGE
eukprot:scaffold33213_cov60-Phaeocystis_antarctica.AAC.7